VSTGSKVSSIAGTMACMIWKGTPYYAHIEYNDKTDPEDGLSDEGVNAIDEIPVYSINKPKDDSCFFSRSFCMRLNLDLSSKIGYYIFTFILSVI
jgi:hypothetical protein